MCPRLFWRTGSPWRAVLREPRAARGCASAADGHPDAAGTHVASHGATLRGGAGPTGGCWAATAPSGTAQRHSPPAQGGLQILGKADVVDVPMIMQLVSQQSLQINSEMVPQIQFIVRVRSIPVASRDGCQQCKIAQNTVETPQLQASSWLGRSCVLPGRLWCLRLHDEVMAV